MPIYEFYCPDCHTVFSFFSQTSKLRKKPACPRCSYHPLQRRPSTFAMVKSFGKNDEGEPDLFENMDESKLEGAMDSLASQMEKMGDDADPRSMGQVFRRFGEMTGLEMGPRMEEALQRMESGEDIESIEADLEDGDDDLDDLFQLKKRVMKRTQRPAVDETLHFL